MTKCFKTYQIQTPFQAYHYTYIINLRGYTSPVLGLFNFFIHSLETNLKDTNVEQHNACVQPITNNTVCAIHLQHIYYTRLCIPFTFIARQGSKTQRMRYVWIVFCPTVVRSTAAEKTHIHNSLPTRQHNRVMHMHTYVYTYTYIYMFIPSVFYMWLTLCEKCIPFLSTTTTKCCSQKNSQQNF